MWSIWLRAQWSAGSGKIWPAGKGDGLVRERYTHAGDSSEESRWTHRGLAATRPLSSPAKSVMLRAPLLNAKVQAMFKNLWAPWRMEYINDLANPGDCFLCGYIKTPADDGDNLVLWRSESTLACMNRFPYTNGHLLIAPKAHKSDLTELSDGEMLELMQMLTKGQQALRKALNAQGFNVGINLGRCAGAGLPGHLHFHIVPRWEGDTNFMAVTGQTRVIPQDINESYRAIKAAAE